MKQNYEVINNMGSLNLSVNRLSSEDIMDLLVIAKSIVYILNEDQEEYEDEYRQAKGAEEAYRKIFSYYDMTEEDKELFDDYVSTRAFRLKEKEDLLMENT